MERLPVILLRSKIAHYHAAKSDLKLETQEYILSPNPDDPALSSTVEGIDQHGVKTQIRVIEERAITLYLNSQEIVTIMTVGDYPEYLAIGFLRNQNMLHDTDVISSIDYDDDLAVIIVRTERVTDYEEVLKKKVRTSGCAQGTVFDNVLDRFKSITLPKEAIIRTSWLGDLTKKINTRPSLYLTAGAIHSCVLCRENLVLAFVEDVGRHNAVDKIAGWMHQENVAASDKIFYTTGRLTSEMVIKTVLMEIPILVSRSGFTASGVSLARQAGLTLIGRARGQRFIVLSGEERVCFDTVNQKDDP
ncbi:MAG: formate dehydrogenase accessory sulfurtransferase FdhD [Cohaesibacteraceae bacterium]|nr:formate dehydrogenase accessory sulfurtransferase FdhD [Cohaesibacteraceae bacterium]